MALNETRRLFFCEVMCVEIHPQSRRIAVHKFNGSSFGAFLNELFKGAFTKPSHVSFLLLSLGFVFAFTRHTVASYLWRAGAATFKHFTRFYVFLGGPCHDQLDGLFERVIIRAAGQVPEGELVRVRFDETTTKKTGRKIEGCSTYRNGAGSARQEYRTLFGLNFVLGEMRIRLSCWKDHFVSVPIGLALYLKEKEARKLNRPYRTRSELAREMLDRVCRLVGPKRTVLSVQDGNYATKAFLQDLPENARVVGRLYLDSPLYARPEPKPPSQPGPEPKKGPRLGNPQELAEAADPEAWQPHREDEDAEVLTVEGLWHSVMPEVWLRVVILRRPQQKATRQKKELEAFFTSLPRLSAEELLKEYRGRWSIEILIREAREHYGLGQDRCRKYERIVGVNGLRMLLGASQVLWFARELEQHEEADGSTRIALRPYQPWYKQKQKPSLHDITWAVRERLMAEGITPTVGIWQGVGVIHRLPGEQGADQLPRAA
ncbi:MAG TPA: transposase [Acidobacteriota bacterium]|nr:transposase [Acidobacteriota bacterium]